MYEYKLQIGCLLVVMYIVIFYLCKTRNKQLGCNRMFDLLLIVTPWAIIFDGITAWTVNHLDVVPLFLNQACHVIFYVIMDFIIIFVYVYVIEATVGTKNHMLILLPGAISIIGIFLFANDIYYIQGKTTWYSMGHSVVSCYASLLFHDIIILVLLFLHRSAIEREKRITLGCFLAVTLMILCIQIIFPEALISSLFPMVAVIGIYVSFEDPSIKKLKIYNEEIVAAFATLVENRDNNTGGHIKRTKEYVKIILEEMSRHGKYNRYLSGDYIKNVMKAAPMHDIGKISTPDSILQKPGKLTKEEFDIMKQHSAIGSEIINDTFAEFEDKQYQKIAYEVARYHHEKWNGMGYPEGLKGEEIPLHARIMAIADVFDAVSAKRCYRDAMPLEKCFQIIEEGIGTDFDPELATLFLNARDKIETYYKVQ